MSPLRVRAVVPAAPASSRVVREVAVSVVSRIGLPAERLQQVRVAVGEALTWVLSRVGEGDDDGRVGVTFTLHDESLRVSLFHPAIRADDGKLRSGDITQDSHGIAHADVATTGVLDDPASVSLTILAGLVPRLEFAHGRMTLGW